MSGAGRSHRSNTWMLRGKTLDLMTKRHPTLRLFPTLLCCVKTEDRVYNKNNAMPCRQGCLRFLPTLSNAPCHNDERQMRHPTTTFGIMEVRDVIEKNGLHPDSMVLVSFTLEDLGLFVRLTERVGIASMVSFGAGN